MSAGATENGAVVRLRPPNNTLNERVVGWWRVQSLIGTATVTAVLAVLGVLIDPARGWLLVAAAVVAGLGLLEALVVPGWRYRVHRWEVTDEAVYVRTGAFWQEWHIAPTRPCDRSTIGRPASCRSELRIAPRRSDFPTRRRTARRVDNDPGLSPPTPTDVSPAAAVSPEPEERLATSPSTGRTPTEATIHGRTTANTTQIPGLLRSSWANGTGTLHCSV